MTRPTARVLALLEILQSGGTRTGADLAERLEVDERTVRRYVEHLVDLEIPVRSVRGRYGGYRLAPGFRMPPLMLTDDEAVAVLLGLVAGRRAGWVPTSEGAMRSAAAKVRRVLPAALGRRLDALLATASVGAARPGAAAETGVLLLLAEAARDRRPVALTYTDRHGRASERTLHPYGIVVHSGRWYVTGSDSARAEVRTFRLDRIESATPLPGEFDVPDGFDPAERVASALASVPYEHEVSVRIRATAGEVRARISVATLEELADGWVRARLRVESLHWVPSVLAWLDRPFVVEEPAALRAEVLALAQRLIASGEAGGPP